MVNKSKSQEELSTAKYCDAYCTCPLCGGGPDSTEPEYRHIYWPKEWDIYGNRICNNSNE